MDYRIITEEICKSTTRTAAFIQQHAGKVAQGDIEIKSRNSLVSFVDKTAEQMLVEDLGKLIPEAGFITEEGMVHQHQSEFTWIIDPLDGTTNYLQDIPVYSISVALVHNEEIVCGVVHSIPQHEIFFAWKGGGAWLNGTQIHVSGQTIVQDTVVATGFPYAHRDVLPKLTAVFEYFLEHARGIRRLGSAAVDLAYVACGRFDVYYETSLNAWDIAAGILLVEEAGGAVSDFSGGRNMLRSGQVIAAAPGVHAAVVTHIQEVFG